MTACSLDWYSAKRPTQKKPQVGAVFYAAVQPGAYSAAWNAITATLHFPQLMNSTASDRLSSLSELLSQVCVKPTPVSPSKDISTARPNLRASMKSWESPMR